MSSKRKVHTITTIHTDGTITEEQLPDDLDTLQSKVGGSIEHVPAWGSYEGKRCTVWCNENGIAEGLAYNPTATRLWTEYLEAYKKRTGTDYDPRMVGLLGPIVIVTRAAD